MFLTSKHGPGNSNHFWHSFVRTGSVFAMVTFVLMIILAVLLSITLIEHLLGWVTILIWGPLFLFAMAFQILHLWYMRSTSFRSQKQKTRFVPIQEQPAILPEANVLDVSKEQISLKTAQITAAFEIPFQNMGVRTENYRQEIEEAINTLYRHNVDQQAFSLCLYHLLQAAKQSWAGLAEFSPREREILELLLQNISYKEMSRRLHVSISTIKTHVYHVFQKLDISNREEAICLIRERGWFFENECDLPPMNKYGKFTKEVMLETYRLRS